MISLASLALFLFFIVPNYNDGENLAAIIVVGFSFAIMLSIYAYFIFEPFGDKWKQKKAKKILQEQNEDKED